MKIMIGVNMNDKEIKTIGEWLVERLTTDEFNYIQTIDDRADLNSTAYSFKDALSKAFVFRDTIQGHNYWIEVCNRESTIKRKSRIENLKL